MTAREEIAALIRWMDRGGGYTPLRPPYKEE